MCVCMFVQTYRRTLISVLFPLSVEFRNGSAPILIATDVVGRGLGTCVSHVYVSSNKYVCTYVGVNSQFFSYSPYVCTYV